jgi:soluble lytic murein transglycosylase
MPTVPTYGGPQVSPTNAQPGGFAAPTDQNAAPQQGAQAGEALKSSGTALSNIALDMQQQANQVRLDDALNKTRQQMLSLQYDPQAGYINLKGDAALTRPDGVSLDKEYGDKLNQSISDISDSLGNDAQRRAFQMQANDLRTQFQAGVQQHLLSEYREYALSTQSGTIKLGVDGAKLNWNDPDLIRQNLDSVRAAVYRAGSLQGLSGNEITANLHQTVSAAHSGVIESALANQNPSYAQLYLQQHKGDMTADDILKATGLVNHDLDGRMALTAVQGAVTKLAPVTQPTDMGRLSNIVMGMESGGDTSAVGPFVKGQGSAKGSMQVMDATNVDPGYGVTPAKDNSPAERARVGRDYLAAMVQHYGNPAQAMAAYNAGPGTLDKAVAQAKKDGKPENWLTYLPDETQKYVTKGMAQLNAGGGQPPFPTEAQFIRSALDSLGPTPRLEQVKLTQQQAAAQYEILVKSRTEQGNQAVQQAQQALIQNGGNFAALSPQLKSAVQQYAPDKYDNLQDYAGRIASPVKTDNLAAYNQAISNPDEMAAMPDPTFESFMKLNFTPSTAETLARLRDDWKTGKVDLASDTIHQRTFNDTVNNRLLSIGINPTPKESDLAAREQVGTIKKYVHDSIQAVQNETGKKMTPAEVESHVTGLFAKDANFRTTYMGMIPVNSQQKMLSMTVSDIPDDSLAQLRASFARNGNANPTNDQLLRAYWKVKNAK